MKTVDDIQEFADGRRRSDGIATRKALIEAAGQLIADRGFADTRAREICRRARANPAAVNYHFGSYRGLYLAVLEDAHDHLVSLDELEKLKRKHISTEQKIEKMLDLFIRQVVTNSEWQVLVILREVISPSELFMKFINYKVVPKENVVHDIIADYLGLERESHEFYSCLLMALGPLGVLTFGHNSMLNGIVSLDYSFEDFAADVKSNIMMTLRMLREKYAASPAPIAAGKEKEKSPAKGEKAPKGKAAAGKVRAKRSPAGRTPAKKKTEKR